MFQLLGNDPQVAGGKAREILELETGLARTSVARATLRDPQQRYHPMTKAELAKLAPDVPWEVYFQQVGAPAFDTLNVSTPESIRAVAAAIRERPVSAWKAYLTYRLGSTRASRLPAAFDQEFFDFYQRTLGGFQEQRPREKRCAAVVDSELGDLLGQKYIERAFGGRSKEEIAQLVAALERSLGNDIRALPW